MLKYFLCWLQEWSWVSYKRYSPGIYPFDEILAAELGFKSVLIHLRSFFYFFFHLHLFDGVCFLPIFLSTCKFSFSLSVLILFWFGNSILSVICLGFSLVCMVKLQFLAQFPVDHLTHTLMPSLILFLC